MMTHNEGLFNLLFGENGWVVKAKATQKVLNENEIIGYKKSRGTKGHGIWYDEYYFYFENDDINMSCRFVKTCNAWKVTHWMSAKTYKGL